jgi:uncharacterized protein YecE (DUF72 family)
VAGCLYVGTAGWSIPRTSAHHCATEGTHLARYARLFRSTEINSSFYRPHAAATYAKWAAATPPSFRFAIKVPQLITHEHALRRSRGPFRRFLAETAGLGSRRGPLLVQLPPSFAFAARPVASFFEMVRTDYEGPVVCEPRHPTWFTTNAHRLLARYRVARVAADPPIVEQSATPGGWDGLAYFRLHGSPRMYWSRYAADYLSRLANTARQLSRTIDVWCVFDNTASGSAFENAWELQELMRSRHTNCIWLGGMPQTTSARKINTTKKTTRRTL